MKKVIALLAVLALQACAGAPAVQPESPYPYCSGKPCDDGLGAGAGDSGE